MSLPMVGGKHQRKAGPPQTADWGCGNVPQRICSQRGRGRSSTNHQQSDAEQELAKNNNQHSLGALLSRGVAPQRIFNTGCVLSIRKKLDSATLGRSAVSGGQDCRSRTLATWDKDSRRNQSQNQGCHVGFVFSCRSLGLMQPQSDLVGNTGRGWRKEGTQHWRTHQRQAPEVTFGPNTRASEARPRRLGIPGSALSVFGRSTGSTPRGTGCPAMEGLRFRRSRLQCPALLLLETRRSSEGHKDRSIGKAIADASCAERCPIGMEIDELVYWRRALCFSFPTFQRAEAARFGGRFEAQDPAGVLET